MDEYLRQITHLLFGAAIAFFVLFTEKNIAIPIFIMAIFSGFVLSDAIIRGYRIPLISGLIDALERKDAFPGKGTFYFVISALFCLSLFDRLTVFVAIIGLSVVDSASTVFGISIGKHRIFNGKSFEGFLAGVLFTLLIFIVVLPPVPAILLALIAGLVELLSPIDDNLMIPVSLCILATLLPVI